MLDESSAVRGCSSDEDVNHSLCNVVGEWCIECTEEFCNLQSGKTYVSCLTCSSDDDESCGYLKDEADPAKLCESFLGRENLCFAYGNQTQSIRGCLNEFPELLSSCTENSEICQICDEDSCNFMNIVEEFCYVCDSTTDPLCESPSENLTPTLCGESTFNISGCYLSDEGKIKTNLLSFNAK